MSKLIRDDSHGDGEAQSPSLWSLKRFSIRQYGEVLVGLLIVAGGVLLFAASPPMAALQAEQMKASAGAQVITDSSASGGQAVVLSSHGSLNGTIKLPSAATSVTVIARATSCNGQGWPLMSVHVDQSTILTQTAVKSTSWQSYTAQSLNLPAGVHSVRIGAIGFGSRCLRKLTVDVVNFYGSGTPQTNPPTAVLSATPTTVTAGQTASLSWGSANAVACVAGGGWSGAQALNGTATTAPITADTTYTLTCNDASGNKASATATVTVKSAAATANCFPHPGSCGYPDPTVGNVGPSAACSALTPVSGHLTVDAAYAKAHGTTVANLNLTGGVTVATSGITFSNDCISANGGGQIGSAVLYVSQGVTGTQVNNSSVFGANATNQSAEMALDNDYRNANTSASKDYIYNCGECLHGHWNVSDSYVYVPSGVVPASLNGGVTDHYEDLYTSDDAITLNHNTLINANEQTANIFGDTHVGGGGPGDNNFTITNNFLVGGGAAVYGIPSSSSNGTSSMDIENNRFARCTTAPIKDGGGGGQICSGPGVGGSGGTGTPGADTHGYFPNGGFFFPAAYLPTGSATKWSGNYWDDNLTTVNP